MLMVHGDNKEALRRDAELWSPVHRGAEGYSTEPTQDEGGLALTFCTPDTETLH